MEYILETSGIDKVAVKLTESGELSLDPIDPFARIVEDMMRVEAALFESQGRRGGGSWKPLKPDTIKRKFSSEILVATGKLRDSLTVPGAQYQILEVNKSGFAFGTDRPFAAVQHGGSSYNNRPPRPIMKFTIRDTSRWTHWLAEHIMLPFKPE